MEFKAPDYIVIDYYKALLKKMQFIIIGHVGLPPMHVNGVLEDFIRLKKKLQELQKKLRIEITPDRTEPGSSCFDHGDFD